MPTAPPLLSLRRLHCRLDARRQLVVDRLDIRRGEHWCVFGGNGAGKTLLATVLQGRLPACQSALTLAPGFEPRRDLLPVSFEEQRRLWEQDNRHDISEYNANAQDAGTIVLQLILQGRALAADLQPELNRLLAELQIADLAQQGIRFLSSGQLRKAMLARALFARQLGLDAVLLLDDPLESIDRESRDAIQRLLKGWMDDSTCSIQLCRRRSEILPGITHLALLSDLRVVQQGPLDEVLASAACRELWQERPIPPVVLPPTPPASTAVTESEPLIELVDVELAYGGRAVLSDINWRLERGRHVLIEGPNGCGKSSLLGLIDGDNHKAYGQRVSLFGRRRGSGESVWDIKRFFGVVSNELHGKYVRGWRVLDVVVSGFFDSVGLYQDSGASQADAARAWLRAFGIDALARDFYHTLSFGQQRLVLLARAMVKNPAVLILDEPCVGLDDHFRRLILAVVDGIAAQTSTQIIYVSHTVGEAPDCINQWLRFVPGRTGTHTLRVSDG
ncbi:MAG: hypothetical protein RLZZ385_568 [Pseudomonadota bacterium]|jgi:molybdate transport system ATP-binding protein